MKKHNKIITAVLFTLIFCGTLFVFGCSGNEISLVNYRWDLSLPTTEEPIYSYEDKGFGDGTYYYVLDVSTESLNINFSKAEPEREEEITGYYSSVLSEADSQYYVDFSHEIFIYYESKNGGFDKLYLIYDYDLSRLTVFEMN